MAWIWLVAAGLLEVAFAVLLKLSEGFTRPLFTVGFIVSTAVSFYCLTKAMHSIPMGTAYIVWIGIGAIGVVLYGIIQFNEPLTVIRVMLMTLLVLSIIGLKVTSSP